MVANVKVLAHLTLSKPVVSLTYITHDADIINGIYSKLGSHSYPVWWHQIDEGVFNNNIVMR